MLFRAIKFELSRAFRDKYFVISLLIGGIIVTLDIVTFYTQYIEPKNASLIQAWIGTDFAFAYHSLYYILLPVIACLTYGGSYYMDMSTGYDKNILLRMKRSYYLLSKMIAVFVSAFLSVAIPLLANLFIVAGIYRNELPERLTFTTLVLLIARDSLYFLARDRLYIVFFVYNDRRYVWRCIRTYIGYGKQMVQKRIFGNYVPFCVIYCHRSTS